VRKDSLNTACGEQPPGARIANTINPPPTVSDLPNPVDPRGLLTFGVAGAALFIVGWLILRGGRFPKGLGYLAYLSAILLVALYLGPLIILESGARQFGTAGLPGQSKRKDQSSVYRSSGWPLPERGFDLA
jgi:hypothetical protein